MANHENDNQKKILAFIKDELRSKGYPPSVREICDAIGLKSTSTVHGHLARLEKKGFIRRDASKPRAIEILDEDEYFRKREMVNIPMVGRVTAGLPILAVENIDGTFPVPYDYIQQSGNLFMLTIQGESMINAGILDGDNIIVKQQPDAVNGDIVVALLGEEATVKRFYKEKDHFRLQPENTYMQPIYVDELQILGKVVGLFRKL